MAPADSEAFTRLWTRAQPAVAAYIASLVPNLHEAEDLLQNVAVVLLRKFPEYDALRPFEAWAIGIAKFEVLSARRDHARAKVRFRSELVEAVADAFERESPELERRMEALRECLKRVDGRNREVLLARYRDDQAPATIAQALGMASGAIRVRLNRVRAALMECIERRLAAAASGGAA